MKEGPSTALPIDFERPPQLKSHYCLMLALISGVLLTLCFEPFNLYFLAWVAYVPALTGLRCRKDKMVFWTGTVFGYAFLLSSLFWLRTIHTCVPFLLAMVWSPLWGFWAWITKKMWFYLCFPDVEMTIADARNSRFLLSWKKYLILIFASSAIWVFLEWLRFWMFSGFPWNVLGITQAYCSPILPVASFFGVLGISFLLIFTNLSISFVIESFFLNKKFLWQLPVIAAVLFFVTLLSGQLSKTQTDATSQFRAVLVQGNFYPVTDREITQDDYLEQIQTYRNLSLKHAVNKPSLIIWPETPVVSSYSGDPFYEKTVKNVARICQSKVLLGSTHKESGRKTNSAFLIDKSGRVLNRYDKIHLVPYGEYTPMKDILPSPLWNRLNNMVSMGNLDTGTIYDVMQINDQVTAGVNICFEDVFPDNSREYVRSGANLLITLTNDSWYKQTAGGAQHTAHSIFRAVENGLPMLRCGTTSESCYISPEGKVSDLIVDEKGSRFARGTAVIDLEVSNAPGTTFFYRHPHLFIILSSGIAFLAFLITGLHFLERKSRLRQIISGTN